MLHRCIASIMQMRGNTWRVVEEDHESEHFSRPHKETESKQQGKGDKRQATGTVGTSMAGDVLGRGTIFPIQRGGFSP